MIDGLKTTDLNVINSSEGTVRHYLNCTDDDYKGFGEVYFSTVKYNSIKAWKKHKQMTLNLNVPVGKVLFIFYDDRVNSVTYGRFSKIIMDQNKNTRLHVCPGIWFGFKGLGRGVNLISNIADIIHDPREVLRKEISSFKIEWNL